MPTTLPTASPLIYPETITVPNPGEPRTIESIRTAPSTGMTGINNRVEYMRSRHHAAMTAPMQGVASDVDTGRNADVATISIALHYARLGGSSNVRIWLAATPGGGSFYSYDGINWDITNDIASVGGSESAWHEMASDGTRVVIVGDNEVRNAGWPLVWAACTGGVTSGMWRAVVHDGTNFIAGSNAGQFSYSADGQTFSSVVNGGANWLAGSNEPAQISTGKGPDGVSDRAIAVPEDGDLEVFAVSDSNGATWSDVVAPSAVLTWSGVAYRAMDHTWIAVGSAMGSTSIYASTDGGATWVHQQSIPGGNESKVWVMNDHFVMMAEGGGLLRYAYDVDDWRLGLKSKRATGAGTVFAIRSFVMGAGRFAWVHMILNLDICFAMSQAGDCELGDPL